MNTLCERGKVWKMENKNGGNDEMWIARAYISLNFYECSWPVWSSTLCLWSKYFAICFLVFLANHTQAQKMSESRPKWIQVDMTNSWIAWIVSHWWAPTIHTLTAVFVWSPYQWQRTYSVRRLNDCFPPPTRLPLVWLLWKREN